MATSTTHQQPNLPDWADELQLDLSKAIVEWLAEQTDQDFLDEMYFQRVGDEEHLTCRISGISLPRAYARLEIDKYGVQINAWYTGQDYDDGLEAGRTLYDIGKPSFFDELGDLLLKGGMEELVEEMYRQDAEEKYREDEEEMDEEDED
jgi:hypothetical protein